jgi:sterol desaturase/sphingolipid hydroxylase (fatty acid hydroxylase superfamily)
MAAKTETFDASAVKETSAGNPLRNPKDSMRSTWRHDYSQWTAPHHYLLHFFNIYSANIGQPIPVHQKSDPIPYLTQWSLNRWILSHAAWPMAAHWIYSTYTGYNFTPIVAFLYYMICFQLNSIHQLWVLRRMGHTHGYFDGDKHGRDEVPDVGVVKTVNSLLLTTSIRPILAVFLAYRATEKPNLSWWLPVEVGLYPIILDFWFYSYHRACHELDGLWQYHRTHHLTKHPSPLLSSYADSEQEFIELALVPVLTYGVLKLFGFPMTFYDWWVCHTYIIFTEAFGHSGIRVWGSPAGTFSGLLRLTGTELTIEDHDMHHRKGWKHSSNYGKATRVWDRLLGTCGERVEGYDANIDYVNTVNIPAY